MRFQDAPRDVETESQTPAVATADLPESPEDGFQVLGGNSGAGDLDRDTDLAAGALGPDGDVRASRAELDRVGHQIREDLKQALMIEPGRQRRPGGLHREGDSVRIG